MNSREYYMLKKDLDDLKLLIKEVIKKQEKIELCGEVIYGEPDHIGRKQKYINISLRKPLKQSC